MNMKSAGTRHAVSRWKPGMPGRKSIRMKGWDFTSPGWYFVTICTWGMKSVLEHCDRLVVGHLNPGGMLACILAEADPEKEIVFL